MRIAYIVILIVLWASEQCTRRNACILCEPRPHPKPRPQRPLGGVVAWGAGGRRTQSTREIRLDFAFTTFVSTLCYCVRGR